MHLIQSTLQIIMDYNSSLVTQNGFTVFLIYIKRKWFAPLTKVNTYMGEWNFNSLLIKRIFNSPSQFSSYVPLLERLCFNYTLNCYTGFAEIIDPKHLKRL